MERMERTDTQFQLQEYVRSPRQFRRWLGRLARRTDLGSGDGDMSGGNGSNGDHDDAGSSGQSAEPTKPFKKAFDLAIKEDQKEADREAGSSCGRICPPLLLGPQRYRDPAIYSPDWRRRAPIGSKERADAEKNPIRWDDPQVQDVLKIMLDIGFPVVD